MKMKKIFTPFLLLISSLYIFQACSGDYRKDATGPIDEIYVVMDSTKWDSQTANAIRKVFGSPITTLPSEQPRFDLHFLNLKDNSDLEFAKEQKNVIFAAPLNDSTNTAAYLRSLLSKPVQQLVENGKNFAFPLKNKWYRNQWTLLLTSTSDSALANRILDSEQQLLDNIMAVQRERYTANIYDQGEQVAIEDTLWKEHGWKIRVEHDYTLDVDTADFVTLRRSLPDNDRWIWVWWKNNVNNIDYLDPQWVNATRDSINEARIQGTEDSAYVTTEYRTDVISRTITFKGFYGIVTHGRWHMHNGAMGGPFVNYTFYVPYQHRLYSMEFAEFAPRYKKRRFVREFEAMAYTFKADSTLTPAQLAGKSLRKSEAGQQAKK
jgi:hypothetical protein